MKTTERNLDDQTQNYPPTIDYFNGDGQLEKRVRNAGSTTAEIKNYYIRSSVLNKVISESDKTGKKLKTFVPANGTTLAVQTLSTYNGSTTEILDFNHTDASGTGAQQTAASGALIGNTTSQRTAEYSPLGRNIGSMGPYITLNTSNPPNEGGIDMFGSGQGYRPGQNTYRIDGLTVSESQFMFVINSGEIGGIFGLLEMAARMSTRVDRYYVEYGYYVQGDASGPPSFSQGGPRSDFGFGFDAQERVITGYGLRVTPIYNSSWSTGLNAALEAARQTGKPAPLNDKENENLDKRIDELINDKLNSQKCKDFLISKLGLDGYEKLIETLKDPHLRYSAGRSKDITVEDAGIYGANARQVFTYLSDKKNTKDRAKRDENKRNLEYLDWSVSKWSNNIGIHAVLGNINGNGLIFYASFKKITTILHENMHISTGLNDVDFANRPGLKDGKNSFVSNSQDGTFKASRAISQALIDNKCTN